LRVRSERVSTVEEGRSTAFVLSWGLSHEEDPPPIEPRKVLSGTVVLAARHPGDGGAVIEAHHQIHAHRHPAAHALDHWKIAPAGAATTTRRYLDDTLVLETIHETPEGVVKQAEASKRGQHSQSTLPSRPISAALRPSPTSA
jgi:hypothetical protein